MIVPMFIRIIFSLSLCAAVQAQVIKCVDPRTRAVSYADTMCPDRSNGVEVPIMRHPAPVVGEYQAIRNAYPVPEMPASQQTEYAETPQPSGSGYGILDKGYQQEREQRMRESRTRSRLEGPDPRSREAVAPAAVPQIIQPAPAITYCQGGVCYFDRGPPQFVR